MTSEQFVNIYKLINEYNVEIDNEVIPDNLKCVKCKTLINDACQLPCGCGFCRTCIDGMIENGDQFCPGVLEECEESNLSQFLRDYRANRNISRLIVKCPQNECSHECQLANIEEHLRVCPRKDMECPFNVLGCTQSKLIADEMSLHLLQEQGTHSEMLIGTIANFNNEIEDYKREICVLKQNDDDSKREIEMMKRNNDANRREIEMLKLNLLVKDRETRALVDVNSSIKDENELIKTENQSNRNEIESIKDKNKLIKDEIKSMKDNINLLQVLVGQVDARYEFVIDANVGLVPWGWEDKMSDFFTGISYPYKYRLASSNYGTSDSGLLQIDLCIYPCLSNTQLRWPFHGTVIVTVADKVRLEASKSISRLCQIEKPSDDYFSYSNPFVFSYSKLIEAGLDLGHGIRMSCQVVPMVDM